MSNEEILKKLKQSRNFQNSAFNEQRLHILKIYKNSLDAVRLDLSVLFEKYGENISYERVNKHNRLLNLERKIQDKIRIADRRIKQSTKSFIGDTYTESYLRAGFAYESSTGFRLGFANIPTSTVEAAILNPMDRITWINRMTAHGRTLNRGIATEIAQGLIQGKTNSFIAREIKKRFETGAKNIIRVVQTESHRASILGAVNADDKFRSGMEKLGIQVKKVWISTLDDKTREDHQNADGQEADKDGYFTIAGIRTLGPGLTGVAKQDINCRCNIISEVEGLTPTIRRDNESGDIIKWTTYKDWKAGKKIK